MPECENNSLPQSVIYQTAEDGLADNDRKREKRQALRAAKILA